MKSATRAISLVAIAGFPLFFLGCEKSQPSPAANGGATPNQTAPSLPVSLFVEAQPANAKSVEEVKSTAKAGDSVVVRGRIGGSEDPFVAERAVFTLVGSGLKACSDNPEDKCKTPWDYCCDTAADIAKHSATIQITDANGAPIKSSIKGQKGIKELSELVVAGKVVQATDKVTIISASAVYVAKP